MLWEPTESPIAKTRRSAYKLIGKVREAFILLLSSWRMEPRHFRPEAVSIYKTLNWWVPMIPGGVYAWAAQPLFTPSVAQAASNVLTPNSLVYCLPICNSILFMFLAHLLALTDFSLHALICRVGRGFQMRESPPPYEFFLVRASGLLMWLAIAACFMAMPVLAQEHNTVGYIASSIMAIPLIWIPVFMFVNLSWQQSGRTGHVGLKKMYQSHRFVNFVWITQCCLAAFGILVLFFLAQHPNFLVRLLLPQIRP